MSPFPSLRRQLASAPWRGFVLLLVLCVVGSSWPRLQVHAHADNGHGYEHGHAHEHGHGHVHAVVETPVQHDQIATGEEDPARLNVHVHDATTVTVALAGVPQIDLPLLSLLRWNPP